MADKKRYYPESFRPAPATDGYSQSTTPRPQAPTSALGWGKAPSILESLAQRSHDMSNAMTTQPYTPTDIGAHGDQIQEMWRRRSWAE